MNDINDSGLIPVGIPQQDEENILYFLEESFKYAKSISTTIQTT